MGQFHAFPPGHIHKIGHHVAGHVLVFVLLQQNLLSNQSTLTSDTSLSFYFFFFFDICSFCITCAVYVFIGTGKHTQDYASLSVLTFIQNFEKFGLYLIFSEIKNQNFFS